MILSDWFEPGFRAGGPIQSIANFAALLSDDIEIFIITSDRDLGQKTCYENIVLNNWISKDGYNIYYGSPDNITFKKLQNIINDINADWIYLNSMYSVKYSIFPQLILYFNNSYKNKVLLAPRGMLKPSALKFKSYKKRIFIALYKSFGLHRKAVFQATSTDELVSIEKSLGTKTKTILLPNLSKPGSEFVPIRNKESGSIDLIYIGRIHPIKNLYRAIELLSKVNGKIKLTIVGQREDKVYWEECDTLIKRSKNITVNLYKEVPNKMIQSLIRDHHALILLTKGENFGHAIFDSLLAGRPVVISDQTPWRNLSEEMAGWDINLNEPSLFIEILERLTNMNVEEINSWAIGAWKYAEKYNDSNNAINAKSYLDFFYQYEG